MFLQCSPSLEESLLVETVQSYLLVQRTAVCVKCRAQRAVHREQSTENRTEQNTGVCVCLNYT